MRLAKDHGIAVGMFLMWGYEGEELEDIAATVEHVKLTNPDVFFTTIAYPIKGTPYFDAVEDRTRLPVEWATASDRDYVIAGRKGREYYRWADEWLRSEVEAVRITPADPAASRPPVRDRPPGPRRNGPDAARARACANSLTPDGRTLRRRSGRRRRRSPGNW